MSQWYVVTGGPSSGKTSTLEYLAKKGFYVIPEAARVIIDKDMAEGKTLAEIRADEVAFQRRALGMKIETEKNAPRDRIVFFDRAIPDSVPYLLVCGVDTRDEIRQILGNEQRYRKVFLMAQVGFEKDYARTEDANKARLLGKLIEEAYQESGYGVIYVPPMPAASVAESVVQRGEFILANL